MTAVSVIIVNFNTSQLTKQCIESVYAYTTNTEIEIILIDNASSDRSIVQVAQQFQEVQFIQNEKNVGFGAANNKGIQIAKGEFVFLLNSDTLLLSDAISTFVGFMRNPANNKVAVCGANLLSANHAPATSFGNFPTILCAISLLGFKVFYQNYYAKHLSLGSVNFSSDIKVVDFISGANMFIRANVLQQTGCFDESFFLYFEETELSYRIQKAGYQSVLLPMVNIVHFEGSSSADVTVNTTNKKINYTQYNYYIQSRKLFYNKVFSKPKAFVLNVLDGVSMIIKSILKKENGNFFYKLNILLGASVANSPARKLK